MAEVRVPGTEEEQKAQLLDCMPRGPEAGCPGRVRRGKVGLKCYHWSLMSKILLCKVAFGMHFQCLRWTVRQSPGLQGPSGTVAPSQEQGWRLRAEATSPGAG